MSVILWIVLIAYETWPLDLAPVHWLVYVALIVFTALELSFDVHRITPHKH